MRIKTRPILAMLAILATAASLQSSDSRADGNRWRSESADFRIGFLTGFMTAMDIASSMIDPKGESHPRLGFGTITIKQVSDELDLFYEDPSNRHIGVVRAIAWVKTKMQGESQERLQEQLEQLRKEESEH